ncbi:MAG: pyridoxamine kinase [Oscillospiraceae bacterium]|nr:pyridoxamine kinase [Oscillospiraceae bacterium]
MDYKRILTIQDISCVGQCSLTVALPILSACGIETAILPSAVLSNHTGGFSGWTFADLTEEIPKIRGQWEKENIMFEGVYTGYLGSAKQIDYVLDVVKSRLAPKGKFICDPAMADNGKLYAGFDDNFVKAMKKLAVSADIILPNITEACFITGTEYRESYDRAYIDGLLGKLAEIGAKTVILTGVSYNADSTGVVVYENGEYFYYKHKKIAGGCHGTGDVYASAFTGALVSGENGISAADAAKIAADFTLSCIEYTIGDKDHWYGVKFEPLLGELIKAVGVYA